MNAAWANYLDHLEVAISEIEHALTAGEAPTWSGPQPPDGPPPDETLARRDGLLVRMVIAAHTIEQRRDLVRAEIQSLPAPRPRHATAYAGTIGGTFDYRG